MTRDEVVDAIKKLTGGTFTEADLKGLEHATDEQLKFILEGWKNIGRIKDKNTWDQVVAVLDKAGSFGALVKRILALLAKIF